MCLPIYAHGEARSHFLRIKLVYSEKSMRQGQADRLRAQDRRRFEEIFLPLSGRRV